MRQRAAYVASLASLAADLGVRDHVRIRRPDRLRCGSPLLRRRRDRPDPVVDRRTEQDRHRGGRLSGRRQSSARRPDWPIMSRGYGAGAVVPPRDPEALAAAILRLLGERSRMARCLRRRDTDGRCILARPHRRWRPRIVRTPPHAVVTGRAAMLYSAAVWGSDGGGVGSRDDERFWGSGMPRPRLSRTHRASSMWRIRRASSSDPRMRCKPMQRCAHSAQLPPNSAHPHPPLRPSARAGSPNSNATHLLRLPFNAGRHLIRSVVWSYAERTWFSLRVVGWLVRQRLRRSPPDVLYVRDVVCAMWLALLAPPVCGAAVIFEAHDLESDNRSANTGPVARRDRPAN